MHAFMRNGLVIACVLGESNIQEELKGTMPGIIHGYPDNILGRLGLVNGPSQTETLL